MILSNSAVIKDVTALFVTALLESINVQVTNFCVTWLGILFYLYKYVV